MKTALITGIYSPKDTDDWYLFKIDENLIFSFRFGGIEKEINDIDFSNYTAIEEPDYINVHLVKIFTDNYWVYVILENGSVISFGSASIDHNGRTYLGILFEKISDFETDFFDEDFSEIILDF